MKLGVVMPAYNQAQYIKEALDSVVDQADELIVINDGSVDGTLDVLRNYDPTLRYLTYEENQGTAFAINKGIECLDNCDWLTWVSSDNVMADDWRQTLEMTLLMSKELLQDPGAIYSGFNWGGRRYMYTEYSKSKLINTVSCFFGPSFMIRKDVWQRHRGKISHDYDNWLRVEEACWEKNLDIISVDKDLCAYRVHDQRATVLKKHEFDADSWQTAARERRGMSRV